MDRSWIRTVDNEQIVQGLEVGQVRDLKLALQNALNKRDWPQVLRIDRLSNRLVTKIVCPDRQVMAKVLEELSEIKELYRDSIRLLDEEIANMSHQTY